MYSSRKKIHKDDEPTESERRISQVEMTSLFRDWAGLPEHILDLIVTKLGPLTLTDYYCFTSICSKWRTAMKLNPSLNIFFHILKLSCPVPMLMIKTEDNNDENRGLYNLLNGITHNVRLPFPYNYRFIGSSLGWLICIDENLIITLLDPYNNGFITLPSFRDASQELNDQRSQNRLDYFIQKAILKFDPRTSRKGYEVVVIYHSLSKLAYYVSGWNRWNFIKLEPEEEYRTVDVIYYDKCIYSVTYFGEIVRVSSCGINKRLVLAFKNEANGASSFYLVESQDENLLLVERFWTYGSKGYGFPKTLKFKVYRYRPPHCGKCNHGRLDEIENIGDQALFVGGSTHSVSVSTINCSELVPNSIYYIAYDQMDVASNECRGTNENSDSGIFDLKTKSFSSHHVLRPSEKYVKPPIWFVPSPKIK